LRPIVVYKQLFNSSAGGQAFARLRAVKKSLQKINYGV
jgi:hypothetical protein